MIPSANLNEFPIEALNTLLNALGTYQVDLENKIKIQEKYQIYMGLNYRDELDNIHLLVTQAINAKVEVRTRERMESN